MIFVVSTFFSFLWDIVTFGFWIVVAILVLLAAGGGGSSGTPTPQRNLGAEAAARAEHERKCKELEELRKTPTSSTGGIRGHRITRQIKMIAVDNHKEQDDADRDFFGRVRACGGNGVINMRVRRQKGGFISIQGDAVVME